MDGHNFGNCCFGQAILKSWLRPCLLQPGPMHTLQEGCHLISTKSWWIIIVFFSAGQSADPKVALPGKDSSVLPTNSSRMNTSYYAGKRQSPSAPVADSSLAENRAHNSLSQQDAWASFGHPNPQKSPFRPPKNVCREFLNMTISSIQLNFFHLNIFPMTLYMDFIII